MGAVSIVCKIGDLVIGIHDQKKIQSVYTMKIYQEVNFGAAFFFVWSHIPILK